MKTIQEFNAEWLKALPEDAQGYIEVLAEELEEAMASRDEWRALHDEQVARLTAERDALKACGHSRDEDACGACLACVEVGRDHALRQRGEAMAERDALTKKLEESERPLVEIFRTAERKWGERGDSEGWSPAKTAAHLIMSVHDALHAACSGDGDLPEEVRALRLRAEAAEKERDEARRERDLAIAHDRQPYPTAEAYEKVCAARDALAARLKVAEETLAKHGAHDEEGCRANWSIDREPCNCGLDAALAQIRGGK